MNAKVMIKNVSFLAPATMTLARGNILLQDGRITKIIDVYDKYFDVDDIIPGDNYIALPGLVDAHSHPSKILYQGLFPRQPLDSMLDIVHGNNLLEDSDTQYAATLMSLINALQHGVTTFGIFTSRPLPDVKAAQALGVRSAICYCQNNIWQAKGEPPLFSDATELAHKYHQLADEYENATTTVSPATASELTATVECIARLTHAAQLRGRRFFMHLHEGASTVARYREIHGCTAVENLSKQKLLCDAMTFIHLTDVSENDLYLLRSSGCALVHCPSSNMFVDTGLMPVNSLLANHAVGLGTDAAMINPADSLVFEAFLCLNFFSAAQKSASVTAEALWNMLTVDGARALGFNDLGLIKEGYLADMIFFDKNKITYPYVNTPLSLLSLLLKELPDRIMINGRFFTPPHQNELVQRRVMVESIKKIRRDLIF